jgi:hypothetical protein
MGGTWVHWGQPHVWREISRYQMRDEIKSSYDFSKGLNKYLLVNGGTVHSMTHDEEVSDEAKDIGQAIWEKCALRLS